MKNFYLGNVENLIVKKEMSNNEEYKVLTKRIIVEENVLFYENCFGRIIRFKDDCPIPSTREIEDFMNDYLEGKSKPGIYNSGAYYDEKSLKSIDLKKEQVKMLKLQRKKR